MASIKQQWLYPDYQLSTSAGVVFNLRFIGAMPVLISTRSVDLNTRTKIAHASIHRVCQDVGLRINRSQHADPLIESFIGPTTSMIWSKTEVQLTVNSQILTVKTAKEGVVVFEHELFLVSFASAGDVDTMDFVCYIAKSVQNTRMCYVFECPIGLAQDLIITIGQAFNLGFKDYKESTNQKSLGKAHKPSTNQIAKNVNLKTEFKMADYRRSASSDIMSHTNNGLLTDENRNDIERLSVAFDNFVDFDENSWLLLHDDNSQPFNVPSLDPPIASHPPNDNKLITSSQPCESDNPADPFDQLEPVGEPWYAGPMSRVQAESLLHCDGDFLVRKSIQQPGQFVLSGLENGKHRHLLLADPNGQVRTKERIFDSIQHLVDYHVQSGAPIRSSDSEIKLIIPVSNHTFTAP